MRHTRVEPVVPSIAISVLRELQSEQNERERKES